MTFYPWWNPSYCDVYPSGGAGGVSDSSTIAAYLASDKTDIILAPGDYRIDQRIILPRGKRLRCRSGIARFLPGSGWVNGSANDSISDSVIRINGSVIGSVNTTLAAQVWSGDNVVGPTSVNGMAIGQWHRIRGQGPQSSPRVRLRRVESVGAAVAYTDSLDVTMTTAGVGAAGSLIQDVIPFIGDRDIPTLEGIYLDWNGFLNCVGVEVQDAVDVLLVRVGGAGLTRSVIDTKAVLNFRCQEGFSRGNNNCYLNINHAENSGLYGLRSDGEHGRINAAGVPRHLVTVEFGCSHSVFEDIVARKSSGVLSINGTVSCTVRRVQSKDTDSAAIQSSRNPLFGGLPMGSVITGSPAAVGDPVGEDDKFAVFGYGLIVDDIQFQDYRGPYNDYRNVGVFAHDHPSSVWSNIVSLQLGRGNNEGRYTEALRINDVRNSVFDNIVIRGGTWGIHTRNLAGAHMRGVSIEGDGTIAMASAIVIGHSGEDFSITDLTIANATRAFEFEAGSEYIDNPPVNVRGRSQRMREVIIDGARHASIMFLDVDSGAPAIGEQVRVLANGKVQPETTGPAVFNAVVSTPYVAISIAASVQDCLALYSGTAPVPDDWLQAGADKKLAVTAAPDWTKTVYQCVNTPSAGLVLVRRLN